MNLINTFLWGNIPAYDVINYSNNEGTYSSFNQSSFDILLAASGDLRILLESSDSLLDLVEKNVQVNVYLNDINEMVAIRNLIMLLILSTKGEEGIDFVLTLWYSIALTD
jgi:hypothetical protein